MKNRWLYRIMGSASALILGILVSVALLHSGLLNGTASAFAHDGCPDGTHECSDGIHCCPAGGVYDCVSDSCDSSKSRTCYTDTDDNLQYLNQCCSQTISCGE